MKKYIKIICIAICLALLVPLAAACGLSGLSFEGGVLASGKVGTAYSGSVKATGSDDVEYSFKLGSSLPAGLTLNPDGTITGTPTQSADAKTFTVEAYAEGFDVVEAEFKITIAPGDITYSGKTLADGKENAPYSASVADAVSVLNGVSITYATKDGHGLPAGLNLSAAGNITGYPSAAVENHEFTVIASAANHSPAEAVFTVTIEEGEGGVIIDTKLTLTGVALPAGEVGTAYSYAIQATGALPQNITYDYAYNSTYGSDLPIGLEFDKGTGIISGTPKDSTSGMSDTDKSGVLQFRISASADGYETVYAVFSLKISDKLVTTNRFHAAYLDLTYMKGSGWSGSANGLEMLHDSTDDTVTNPDNLYLGYLHIPGNTIEFAIQSDRVATGTLAINVAAEFEAMAFNKGNYIIKVNGNAIDYNSFNVRNAADIGALSDFDDEEEGTKTSKFQRFVLTAALTLAEGANTISFTVLENDYMGNGTTAGPEFDYCEILNSGAVLQWRPKVYNKIAYFGS